MPFKDYQIIGFSVLTCAAGIYQLNSLFPLQTVVVLLDTVNFRDRAEHTSKTNCQELAARQISSLAINSQ